MSYKEMQINGNIIFLYGGDTPEVEIVPGPQGGSACFHGEDAKALVDALAEHFGIFEDLKARVAELEEAIVDATFHARLGKMPLSKMVREEDSEMSPPEGHVAVMLPSACRAMDFITCPECNETVPRGWPCSCDDGRE